MFKVGDKVRVIDYSNKPYVGLRGVIISIEENPYEENPYPIRVDFSGNIGTHVFNQEQLTHDDKPNESDELENILGKILKDSHITGSVIESEELQNTKRYQTRSGKQLFDVLEDDLLTYEELRGFYKANIYKYTHRYKQKNGIEDLKKVKVYVDQLIKLEEKQNAI